MIFQLVFAYAMCQTYDSHVNHSTPIRNGSNRHLSNRLDVPTWEHKSSDIHQNSFKKNWKFSPFFEQSQCGGGWVHIWFACLTYVLGMKLIKDNDQWAGGVGGGVKGWLQNEFGEKTCWETLKTSWSDKEIGLNIWMENCLIGCDTIKISATVICSEKTCLSRYWNWNEIWSAEKISIVKNTIHSIESHFGNSSSKRMKRLNKIYLLDLCSIVVCISWRRLFLYILWYAHQLSRIIPLYICRVLFFYPHRTVFLPFFLHRLRSTFVYLLWMHSDCHGFSLYAKMSRRITLAFNQRGWGNAAIS